jgi:hypothetical protein
MPGTPAPVPVIPIHASRRSEGRRHEAARTTTNARSRRRRNRLPELRVVVEENGCSSSHVTRPQNRKSAPPSRYVLVHDPVNFSSPGRRHHEPPARSRGTAPEARRRAPDRAPSDRGHGARLPGLRLHRCRLPSVHRTYGQSVPLGCSRLVQRVRAEGGRVKTRPVLNVERRKRAKRKRLRQLQRQARKARWKGEAR